MAASDRQQDYHQRRESDSQRRRRRVLRQAGLCFAKGGFRATRVSDIAAAADVSKGLIFHFYGDKQALFLAVIEDSLEQWALLSNHRAAEHDDSAIDELRSLFLASFEFVRQHPVLALFNRPEEQLLSTYKPQFDKMNRRWRKRISRSLRRGVDSGEIDAGLDLKRSAAIFHELQTALIRGTDTDGGARGVDEQTVNLAIDLLLKGLAR